MLKTDIYTERVLLVFNKDGTLKAIQKEDLKEVLEDNTVIMARYQDAAEPNIDEIKKVYSTLGAYILAQEGQV